MKGLFVCCALLLLVSACTSNDDVEVEKKMFAEDLPQPVAVVLNTLDDVSLKATFYSSNSSRGLILVHQFAKDRTTFKPLIDSLEGFNIIAIDLRGHGESELNYSSFTDEDFVAMKNDVAAAVAFLKNKGVFEKDISFIGASIGANTVQNYVSENQFDKAILLSPGLNYKGIRLNMKDNGALIVVSKGDSYSYNSVLELQAESPNSEFVIREGSEHGTNMLDADLIEKMKLFLG